MASPEQVAVSFDSMVFCAGYYNVLLFVFQAFQSKVDEHRQSPIRIHMYTCVQ